MKSPFIQILGKLYKECPSPFVYKEYKYIYI